MEQNFQSVTVKEEDIKEEPHDYVIGSQTEDEKPALELHCKTEPHTAEDGTSYNAELVAKTERDTETDGSSDETEITAVEIEVQLEDDEEEQDNRLDLGVSEHPQRTQQKFHGQNEELDIQEPTGSLQHHCTVCRKSFTHQTQLETHQQEEHNHTLEVHQYQDSDKRSFNITQCGEYKVIHVGEKAYTYVECPVCGQLLINKSALKKHMFKHSGEMPYKCDHCGEGFTKRGSLNAHILIHTGETPHKSFTDQTQLESHQQAEPLLAIVAAVPESSHRTQQQFHGQNDTELDLQEPTASLQHHCTVCRKSFTDQTQLDTHQQEKHHHTLGVQHQSDTETLGVQHQLLQEMGRTRLKSQRCPQCGKPFRDLQGHLLTHVEKKKPPPCVQLKPYQCEKCGKVFAQKTGLQTHWRLIHSGVKPHVCVVCGEAFAIALQRWKHMFTHQNKR